MLLVAALKRYGCRAAGKWSTPRPHHPLPEPTDDALFCGVLQFDGQHPISLTPTPVECEWGGRSKMRGAAVAEPAQAAKATQRARAAQATEAREAAKSVGGTQGVGVAELFEADEAQSHKHARRNPRSLARTLLVLQATVGSLKVAAAQVLYYLHLCSRKHVHWVAVAKRLHPTTRVALGSRHEWSSKRNPGKHQKLLVPAPTFLVAILQPAKRERTIRIPVFFGVSDEVPKWVARHCSEPAEKVSVLREKFEGEVKSLGPRRGGSGRFVGVRSKH